MMKKALFLCLLLALSTVAFAGSAPSDKELASLRSAIFALPVIDAPQPHATTSCTVSTYCRSQHLVISCTSISGNCSSQPHCFVECQESGILWCDECV